MSADIEERVLAERAGGGDEGAFEEIFRRYRDAVYRVAFSFTGNQEDALDAVQETFIKAYRALGRYRGESGLYAWLRRIAVNCCIDRSRARGPIRNLPLEDGLLAAGPAAAGRGGGWSGGGGGGAGVDPGAEAELNELREDLAKAVAELSESHRAVFVLHMVEGLSYNEIADAVGCSIGTVMSRLFYARRKLLEKLKPHLKSG